MTIRDELDFDLDLERRLRAIAADPPGLPESVDHYAWEVVSHKRRRSLVPIGAGRGRRQAVALAGALGAVVIAAVVAGLLVQSMEPRPGPTWTLRPDAGQGEWTGLEWHDITATAGGMFKQTPWWVGFGPAPFAARWSGGFAMLGGDLQLWLSKDGLQWSRAQNAPEYPVVVSIGGKLLAAAAGASSSPGIRLSSDGVSWSPVAVPFDVKTLSGLVSARPGVVATTGTADTLSPALAGEPLLSSIYFSPDAVRWTRATLPADLAAARGVSVTAFVDGFVAVGAVADPNGSQSVRDDAGNEWRFSSRAWISHDGLTWAAYDPYVPLTTNWASLQQGRLGSSNGHVHSTDNGQSWQLDDSLPNMPSLPGSSDVGQLASDGSHIVMSVASGARFYVSEGDGRWRQLESGGDIGSLPSDGGMMVLPTGVLWISGRGIYFGEGLSGVAPQGTLGWPSTPTPGPTGALEPGSIVPMPEITNTPTAEPSIDQSDFATPGATSGWTGFRWSKASVGGPSRIDAFPGYGPGVAQVLRWRDGYVATGSVSSSGLTTPSTGVWVSPDGVGWTVASSFVA
jgi:hypothetical protein